MTPALKLILAMSGLLLAGCATRTPPPTHWTITVGTDTLEVPVTIRVTERTDDGPVLATKTVTDGEATFNLRIAKMPEIRNTMTVWISAKAAGYLGGEVYLMYPMTRATVRLNGRPPKKSIPVDPAKLHVGMTVDEVRAQAGDIGWIDDSSGIGGNWTTYAGNTGYAVAYLYFFNGRLVRWSSHSL